jgi:hypothetical protein
VTVVNGLNSFLDSYNAAPYHATPAEPPLKPYAKD